MGKYRMKIEPTGTFYFGSERKFNPVDGERNNYLVHSRVFPQQTTLLGMLRFALLKGTIREQKPQGKDDLLIGPNSFDEETTHYGIISRLSPVFVADKEDELLVEIGLDYQIYKDMPLHLELKSLSGTGTTGDTSETIYYYPRYDPKEESRHYLTCRDASDPRCHLISYDEIFKPCQKPGNQKDRTGKSQEKSFYKQTMYRMEKGYSFVLFLETSRDIVVDGQPFWVTMGGDQSEFKVTLWEENECGDMAEENKDVFEEGAGKVTLLSDTYISNPLEIMPFYYFANVEKTGFRYIRTILNQTSNYADIYCKGNKDDTDNRDKKPMISKMKILVAKGSVFYCSDVRSFVSLLNHPAYRAIGYNYFKVTY